MYSGTCLCGAVAYQIHGDIGEVVICDGLPQYAERP
jgi:hypothetical protein